MLTTRPLRVASGDTCLGRGWYCEGGLEDGGELVFRLPDRDAEQDANNNVAPVNRRIDQFLTTVIVLSRTP
jgi:hypothetical protein